MADPVLVRTVLQNLLEQRLEVHRGPGPWLDRVRDGQGQGRPINCNVRDNGAGFDPAHQDKLFIRFSVCIRPAAFSGTGVGLASVRQIIERHGGHVEAAGSTGQGATFTFTLAAADPA